MANTTGKNNAIPSDAAARAGGSAVDDGSTAPRPVVFFKEQKKIYPKRVWGKYRRLKWVAMIVCLAIYYLAPLIRWDRGPNAPDQAILIDLPARRAYWFFIEIWPQEVYYLTGILVFAAITLFCVTSLFGRVWCGYFCFQTVWTDLFVWVERIVQGDRTARERLANAPWGFTKLWKMGLTHAIWLLIGLCTAGAFVFYFNDAPTLWRQLWHGEASPTVMAFMGGLTLSTYLMAGFAREQVCVYMCPYARFQSAMFDPDTLIITYDPARGEPRGKHKAGEGWDGRGHCINCSQCVQVCPMGIDIRDGLQIDCIACGLCIDACDQIMDKVGLPRGLIRYDTENDMARLAKGQAPEFRIFRPRTYYYIALLALVGGLMLYGLATRTPIEMHALHDRNPLFVKMSSGDIRNGYTIKVLNKTNENKTYALSVEGLPGARLDIQGAGHKDVAAIDVPAGKVGDSRIFIISAPQDTANTDIYFILTDNENGRTVRVQSLFVSRAKK